MVLLSLYPYSVPGWLLSVLHLPSSAFVPAEWARTQLLDTAGPGVMGMCWQGQPPPWSQKLLPSQPLATALPRILTVEGSNRDAWPPG